MPVPRMTLFRLWCLVPLVLSSCSVSDSKTALRAQTRLVGMSEVDLESCLGVPDQHATFGNRDVLTYYSNSTSSTNYSLPAVGGLGFSNGGNCHATFDITDGHVTQVLYSGEKNALAAPDAYCAPILNTCLDQLQNAPAASRASPAPAATTASAPASP